MDFRIKITLHARDDIRDYARFILEKEEVPGPAKKWMAGAFAAISSLKSMPGKHPAIPETFQFEIVVRHLHYHSHRIIFTIDEAAGEVVVLRVFHGARRLKARHLRIAQEE